MKMIPELGDVRNAYIHEKQLGREVFSNMSTVESAQEDPWFCIRSSALLGQPCQGR